MADTLDIHKSIAASRSVKGEDGAVREYFLLRSLGRDEEGNDRVFYSIFSRRGCPDGSGLTSGQEFLCDIAHDFESAVRMLSAFADSLAEPEQIRDIVEDLWC